MGREKIGAAGASSKAQGATEYIVILGVLLLLVVAATYVLGLLPGTASDAKKETYIAQLRAGEPFAIEDYYTDDGKLTVTFANKGDVQRSLTHVLFSSPQMNITQSLGAYEDFTSGMRKVVLLEVPCVDGGAEFEVIIIYEENGQVKEQKMGGKLVVGDCTEGSQVEPGEQCTTDEDCGQGTCNGGVCQTGVGVCDSNEDCTSGNCNLFTHLCDPLPAGSCSPRCSIGGDSIVCEETLADCPADWESLNPQCSVSAGCGGIYRECSALCGGTCAGSSESCGGGLPCCEGLTCASGTCVADGGAVCAGTLQECGGVLDCCEGNYCSNNASGTCQVCRTYGACNATSCCSGYACAGGYIAPDVERNGTECGFIDGAACGANVQCLNGTCYDGLCKNCNTNNVCNPSNGNADCCYGKSCVQQNFSGTYTCQTIVNATAQSYLYDVTWGMSGNWAVVYALGVDGARTNAREAGLAGGQACTQDEQCLSNSCSGEMCVVQSAGSWCACTGSDYASCSCPSGLLCDPENYTCVATPSNDAQKYRYVCESTGVCRETCYGWYDDCALTENACLREGDACSDNPTCCSNGCTGSVCDEQEAGDWCQVSTYSGAGTRWPFGTATDAYFCTDPLSCIYNYTGNSYVCGTGSTIYVSDCTALSQANKVYKLASNVQAELSTCFTISAANVTLDCNGFSINATDQTYAVYASGQDGAVVSGCTISGFNTAVFFTASDGGTLEDNAISATSTGFDMRNAAQWALSGNTISASSYGMYLENFDAGTISANTASSSGSGGTSAMLLYQGSDGNTVSGNTISGNSNAGLYVHTSASNNVVSNMVSSSSGTSIIVVQGSNYFEANTNDFNYTGSAVQKFSSDYAQDAGSNGNIGWWPLFGSSGSDATSQANTAWYNASNGGRNADGSANESLTYWYNGQP